MAESLPTASGLRRTCSSIQRRDQTGASSENNVLVASNRCIINS